MRIISGDRRGHKIEGPAHPATRPTSDRVREAVFNILANLTEGREVYDLFAGTGALGLEALSRGARSCQFVEKDRANVEVIRRNVAHLRYEDRTRITRADAYRWIRSARIATDRPALIFVDAPYIDFQSQSVQLASAFRTVAEMLTEGSALVIQAPARFDQHMLPGRLTWDVRRYGGTCVALGFADAQAERVAHEASAAPFSVSATDFDAASEAAVKEP